MPRRATQRILAVAIALAALTACTKLPPGDIAASLALPSIDARAFSPASLRGKPALVLFVSPTCPYCAATLPAAEAAARAENANVVAVFVVGKAAAATMAVSHAHYAGPALVDDGSLRARFRIEKVPYTLVLGADGRAVDELRGEQSEDQLRSALRDAR